MTPQGRIAAYVDPPRVEPRIDVLPPAQRRIWGRLTEIPLDFVLYGGTGLAMRLGHRSSVDLDLFSPGSFSPGELARALPFARPAETLQSEMDTLTLFVEGVKVSSSAASRSLPSNARRSRPTTVCSSLRCRTSPRPS